MFDKEVDLYPSPPQINDMTEIEDKSEKPRERGVTPTKGDAARSARIKQSLRANLQRRKAKARALKTDEANKDN